MEDLPRRYFWAENEEIKNNIVNDNDKDAISLDTAEMLKQNKVNEDSND